MSRLSRGICSPFSDRITSTLQCVHAASSGSRGHDRRRTTLAPALRILRFPAQMTMATMSRRPLSLLAFAVIAFAPIASAAEPSVSPPARMSSAECEVWARELSFAQSVADHDAAAFASHVEPDAAFSAESPQPLRGRDEITRQWSGLIAGKGLLLSWYPTRTTIGGVPDVASSSGPALYEDLRPGAKQRFHLGAFHSVWHRGQDGVWRVLFDGGQAPVPATKAEAAAFRAGRQVACPGQG
jgi:ketosteroid isomerase-like protein